MSSASARPLEIPAEIMIRVFREAREAFPAECCGWLTGPAGGPAVTGVRPCANAQEQGEHPTAADRTAVQKYNGNQNTL